MAVMQRELKCFPTARKRALPRWERFGAVGTVVLLAVALWLAYNLCTAALSWGKVKLDDLRYGYPRTYQTDGYIGYREQSGIPTHFTVINEHRQVLILIIPGGDPTHVSVIKGPYLFGPGQEFSPATLEVLDTNRDSFADLRLHVAGQTIVYLNNSKLHTFTMQQTQGGSRK